MEAAHTAPQRLETYLYEERIYLSWSQSITLPLFCYGLFQYVIISTLLKDDFSKPPLLLFRKLVIMPNIGCSGRKKATDTSSSISASYQTAH